MPLFTSGGSSVTSANIIDGQIIDADISSSAAIALTKLGIGGGTNSDVFSVEQTTGATHSLTTVANQRVFVLAKGACSGVVTVTLTLQYNAVTKDTVTRGIAGGDLIYPFALMYSEVPGAATQNVTINNSAGVLSDPKIMVLKLKSA